MIIINGDEHNIIVNGSLSYSQVLELAGYEPQATRYTITYREEKVYGTLIPGDSVIVQQKMIFNIVETNNG